MGIRAGPWTLREPERKLSWSWSASERHLRERRCGGAGEQEGGGGLNCVQLVNTVVCCLELLGYFDAWEC